MLSSIDLKLNGLGIGGAALVIFLMGWALTHKDAAIRILESI